MMVKFVEDLNDFADIGHFKRDGGHIVIASPGRLEYMMELPEFKVKELEVLILDEADR